MFFSGLQVPDNRMRKEFSRFSTIVIKIGSNLLTTKQGSLNIARIDSLALEVGELLSGGKKVVIISSGAVAAGMGKVKLSGRPKTLPEFQAAAAAGQISLMNRYYDAFQKINVEVAQLLLTRDDFNDRTRYLNIRNCISDLMNRGIVPIINENDTVAVDELKFGDNDLLAGYVTMGLKADILVMLTSVAGLHRRSGSRNAVISDVKEVTPEIEELVYDEKTDMGTGGMSSKISTAKMVTAAGEPVLLVDGRKRGILKDVFKGRGVGTFFHASGKKIPGRKRWLAFSAQPAGSIIVDPGAVRAIQEKGKSLLPAGVLKVTGRFESGELVAVKDAKKRTIAKGLTNYSSDEAKRIAGRQSNEIKNILGYSAYNELVHRNNMVVEEF